MYLFTRASVINYHKLEARTTEFSCFGSQKSEIKVLARLVPSGDSHKTVTCLSHLLVAADSPWHSLACSCITPLAASIITWPLSLGVFTWPFYKEGHQLLELESTPSWYDLN